MPFDDAVRPPTLTVLSLGAGVQSTTLALMAADGTLPMPDCAIFADTGAEPRATYAHLAQLEAQLPYPVHRVQARWGHLGDMILANLHADRRPALPPFYTRSPRGKLGMLARQCTREAKVRPITAKIRGLLSVPPKQKVPTTTRVELWLGISTDEAQRMKPAEAPWMEHRYPLIEQRISRKACLQWLQANNHPIPGKSACVWCPYHNDQAWRDMAAHAPADFQAAITFDRAIRDGTSGMAGTVYVHRQGIPLELVDMTQPLDPNRNQLSLSLEFGEECEGMCGV